ncbi:hypothetical protein HBA54_03500 [Pelagibius litoralis]|uniref:Type I phosphodiesterase / nucleotide pyrophosphatase n=1 Tax=Pelagibius litoralis TaxID=374515 RepID=A0A967C595_9PROT|nr:hypothetical protein [Pelagibius litoralis]NIA67646.1 hypothetical protein [Pelagibius litoralis]
MAEKPNRLIVLEFNELCPPILNKLMAKGVLPNFRHLHDRSEVFVSTTQDKSLEPWVQWVSYHTGQPHTVHGINELDQGHCIALNQIWDRFAEAGNDTLVFGAMNVGPSKSDKVTVVPDPWSRHVPPSDKEFEIFHRFIAHKVSEHANPDAKSGLAEALAFIRFLAGHGLSFRTVWRGVMQLLLEKTGKRDRRWHRATILDQLSWDVFKNSYQRRRPDVAFFFANSVAFYQHRYWRHMAAEDYSVKPGADELASYGDAIETGYKGLDLLVRDALKLAGDDGAVVLVTALSQEANLKYEDIGGKFVQRPRDYRKLLDWLGAPVSATVEPVMTHQAWASFETEAEARAFEGQLAGVSAAGEQVFGWRRADNRVMFWCEFIRPVSDDLRMARGNDNEASFVEFFAPVGQVNNSQHHPEGAFWIMSPGRPHRVETGKLPLEKATELTMKILAERPAAPEGAS